MTAFAGGPGKTAPKLANDFLRFDPLHCDRNANYLADFTPPVGEGKQLAPKIGSCQHEYSTKHTQSIPPPLDLRADGGTQYKLAVCCKKCRIHADIRISYAFAVNPCPNSQDPLHHFVRRHELDVAIPDRIEYAWQCSSEGCRADLRISFRTAKIQPTERTMLVDTDRLKKAYEAMVREEPDREGIRQATPVEVLQRLRRYIKDALNTEHARRSFPANNKRFGEAFGVYGADCYELLTRLGFRYSQAQGDQEAMWQLPDPPVLDDRFAAQGNSHRELLEDIETELHALIIKTAAETNAVNPAASEGWPLADRDVDRTLAAQGYPRFSSLRRQVASPEELPYFASLGIQPDSADSIVTWAVDKQFTTDPQRQSYYFECLQIIAEARKTEDLQTTLALVESRGLISRRDITAAYRYLDISQTDAQTADDERILNLFYVRTSDSGPEAKEEARRALRKIGLVRQSQRLIRAAEQTIETYEEALDWLGNGANRQTADDWLISFAGTKREENEELTRKAISVIAHERKSDALNQWLLTGQADGYQMDKEEALRQLGITESWATIDKSILSMQFDVARMDRPGEQTEKAIAALEKAIASEQTSRSAETWPVGLTSHGNTCYLNSLLQYYFSIKPLREIVLNYDQYKLDTEHHTSKDERVGHRKISLEEVKGGQRFARDLKQLFDRMIKSPSEHVRPEDDLVCRAFLEMKDYALLSSAVQELRAEHAEKANGVVENENEVTGDDNESAQIPSSNRVASDASSVTLRGEEDVPMQNGELPPTPPKSPPKDDSAAAPPLPPRRFSTTREHALEKAQEKAKAQQDVTEVHDDVLFKLRAGMTPRGADETGEQEDDLHRLFKYSMIETSVKDGVDGKKKPLLDMAITIPPPSGATDIYSVLDQFFDLQSVGETTEAGNTEAYKSLEVLPPLLQINITRIDYNKERGAFKSEACVKLEDELYLDRYIDTSHPDVLPRRKACWSWRQKLHALRKEKKAIDDAPQVVNKPNDLSGPLVMSEAGEYLHDMPKVNTDLESLGMDGVEVPESLPIAVMSETQDQLARLLQLESEIAEIEPRLKDQFSEFKKIKYRLAAVFFHRGSYGHGHYWIYIHDFENDVWRMYNDERVDEFKNVNEILEANTWNHGTPTFAVYVKDDHKTEIVQPVCRAPEAVPEADPQAVPDIDVQMHNGGNEPQGTMNPRNMMVRRDSASGLDRKESSGAWDSERDMPASPVLIHYTYDGQKDHDTFRLPPHHKLFAARHGGLEVNHEVSHEEDEKMAF
ncbi:hypothetical protein CKM354_001115000 [Cercospora kikuchii]|uniref:ubiquitinyl hydrolase 1 n=1 Tax=Cercospora kikuchii TaxID=84275 RepID=A0A9P3FL55_9PEZI|nr:ubiquitin-specific protease UBP2 [Cercospora kikuchii]GIZ48075.1 hypothetical protein CKM354_001115000 [Cercospora kikuchii]